LIGVFFEAISRWNAKGTGVAAAAEVLEPAARSRNIRREAVKNVIDLGGGYPRLSRVWPVMACRTSLTALGAV
jgi:hypothetical protein